jgi:L-ribulose-5-phosphate 3-epimerase
LEQKQYRLGIYEKALPIGLDWRQRLEAAAACGYDYLEMSIDETPERRLRLNWDDEQISQLLAVQKQAGLPIETMCLSAQRKYPLGSKLFETQAKALLRDAILFAKKLGLRIIQTQGYDCTYGETSDDSTKERFYRNLRDGVMFAAMHGVTLAMETMENDFMNTIEKAMTAVRYVDSPWLQVYPDIGNISNATDDVVGDIKKGAGHISAAHLKETVPGKFREIPYGTGQVDFPSAIAQLYKQGVRRFVAEFWHCGEENWKETAIFNRKFLDEQFRKAL